VEFDPAATDPSPDLTHPASLVSYSFDSHGARLNGIAYLPAGPGLHPTVLVLHGFPGNERNLDLAQAFRRAGWNAFVFHYRGAWGSGGDFAFAHVLEDVRSALAFVRSRAGSFRADPDRIALIGHSMGGWASLITASEDPGLLGTGSLAGWNIGAEARLILSGSSAEARVLAGVADSLGPLKGTAAGTLVREVKERGSDWDLEDRAQKLADRPLLILAGSRDAEVPPARHHIPLIDALRKSGATRLTEMVWDTDHAFSDHRMALARATIDWLRSILPTGT
jgi:dipeptidyl aminopeptidase/acylaminoacyl peptidase